MKTKIAHMLVLPIMAGAQQVSYDILKALDPSKYKKYLIVGKGDDQCELDFYKLFEDADVEVIIIEGLRREIGLHDLFVYKKLIRVMRFYKFDIIHTHSTKSAILGRISAKITGIKKIIHTVHGIAFHKEEPFFKRVIFYGVEFVSSLFGDYNILVNKCDLKYYKHLSSKYCFNIYNGVDFSKFNYVEKSSSSFKGKCKILFMGRLDKAKDPLTFLKAINLVVKNEIDIEVLIGGVGELEAECISFVNDNCLNSRVKFLGWVTDKSSLYNYCDILCVPSVFEAFGLVFVEAGYFKLPVVSTNVGGIPEVIEDEITGLIVPPKDHVYLASKLIELCNDPEKRVLLGSNAHSHVTRQFDIKRMVIEYEKVYEH